MNKFFIVIFIFVSCLHIAAQDTIIKYNGEQVYAKVMEINPSEVKYKRFNFTEGPTYIDRKETIKAIRYSNGLKEEFGQGAPQRAAIPLDQQDAYYVPERNNYDYNNNYNSNSNNNNHLNTKIDQRGARFYYRNSGIGENELHRILLKTKDKEIVTQVGKAKDAHIMQFIGFGAIPLGLGAIYLLQNSGFQPFYNPSVYNHGDVALSAVCFIGAIACPIASGIFKHKRGAANREAVELYNEKY
jgi:hypothetical protein